MVEKNGKNCLEQVTNEDFLSIVNEDKQILNAIWQQKHHWMGHVLRHDGLLCKIIEERVKAMPARGRKRLQMLHDLTKGDGYVALKRAAEKRKRWGYKE